MQLIFSLARGNVSFELDMPTRRTKEKNHLWKSTAEEHLFVLHQWSHAIAYQKIKIETLEQKDVFCPIGINIWHMYQFNRIIKLKSYRSSSAYQLAWCLFSGQDFRAWRDSNDKGNRRHFQSVPEISTQQRKQRYGSSLTSLRPLAWVSLNTHRNGFKWPPILWI